MPNQHEQYKKQQQKRTLQSKITNFIKLKLKRGKNLFSVGTAVVVMIILMMNMGNGLVFLAHAFMFELEFYWILYYSGSTLDYIYVNIL